MKYDNGRLKFSFPKVGPCVFSNYWLNIFFIFRAKKCKMQIKNKFMIEVLVIKILKQNI